MVPGRRVERETEDRIRHSKEGEVERYIRKDGRI